PVACRSTGPARCSTPPSGLPAPRWTAAPPGRPSPRPAGSVGAGWVAPADAALPGSPPAPRGGQGRVPVPVRAPLVLVGSSVVTFRRPGSLPRNHRSRYPPARAVIDALSAGDPVQHQLPG